MIGQMDPRVAHRLMEYRAAHKKFWNRVLHVFGIPSIMFGIIGGAVAAEQSRSGLVRGLGWLAMLIFLNFALHLASRGGRLGMIAVGVAVGMWLIAQQIDPSTLAVACAIFFCGGWALQLPGHFLIEGNGPKFFTGIGAFESAPLHVVDEVLGLFQVRIERPW